MISFFNEFKFILNIQGTRSAVDSLLSLSWRLTHYEELEGNWQENNFLLQRGER